MFIWQFSRILDVANRINLDAIHRLSLYNSSIVYEMTFNFDSSKRLIIRDLLQERTSELHVIANVQNTKYGFKVIDDDKCFDPKLAVRYRPRVYIPVWKIQEHNPKPENYACTSTQRIFLFCEKTFNSYNIYRVYLIFARYHNVFPNAFLK